MPSRSLYEPFALPTQPAEAAMSQVRSVHPALTVILLVSVLSPSPAQGGRHARPDSEIMRLRQELKQARHKREPWKWTTFTTKDGLGNDYVWTIHEARDGALWFGTQSGVSRFDGRSWQSFGVEDGLVGGNVRAIHERADGTLWFGGQGGISIYDGKGWRSITQADGLRGQSVTAIHERTDGTLWIGAQGGGVLNILDGTSWRYSDGQSLPVIYHDVGDIDEDERGRVWVTGLNQPQIVLYERGQWKKLTPPNTKPLGKWIRRTSRRADGSRWFATAGGLVAYQNEQWTVFHEKDGLPSDEVSDLWERADGALWIATGAFDFPDRGKGVSRFDGETFETFNTEDGLAANTVLDIAGKRDGTLWFATWGGGVSCYDDRGWSTFTTADGLVSNYVASIDADQSGRLWIGADQGISAFDGRRWQNFTKANGLDAGWAVLQHRTYLRDGRVWSRNSYFDGQQWRKAGLARAGVHTIFRSRDGTLWFGTAGGGVSAYDGASWRSFTTADGLTTNYIVAIGQGSDGALWFGGDALQGAGGGLSVYNGQKWRQVREEDGLSHNTVTAIHGAADGRLWVGTERGVSVLEAGRWRRLTTRDGLGHNYVTSIHERRDGTLWFGAIGGVSILDPKRNRWRYLTPHDGGLASRDVFGIFEQPDGTLWFTHGREGVSIYDGRRWRYLRPGDLPLKGEIVRVYCRSDNTVLVTTGDEGGGVSILEGQQWRAIPFDGGLHAVAEDTAGRLWFRSPARGVVMFDGKRWQEFGGIPHANILAVCQRQDGTIWYGTEGRGIGIWNPKEKAGHDWAYITTKQGLPSNKVTALLERKDRTIWVGTDRGLGVYDGAAWKKLGPAAHNAINALLEQPDGSLWVATSGGVSVLRPAGGWENFTTEDGLLSQMVYTITQRSDQTLWFGANRGVNIYADGIWRSLRPAEGLAGHGVRAIYESPDGAMWFGAWGGGLSRYQPPQAEPETYLVGRGGALHLQNREGQPERFHSREGATPARKVVVAGKVFLEGSSLPAGPDRVESDQLTLECLGVTPWTKRDHWCAYRLDGGEWSAYRRSNQITLANLADGRHRLEVRARDAESLKTDPTPAVYEFVVDAPIPTQLWYLLAVAGAAAGPLLWQYARWRRGRYLGPFEILEKIASGRMGEVYRARSLITRQTVALKVLREELSANKDYVKRFRHEGEIVDAIVHPNIVRVYERGEHQGRCYLAMEYLEGVTLRGYLQQSKRLPIEESVAVAMALCDALEEIHARGIVHRDLKPENIMLAGPVSQAGQVSQNYQVKVLDFGLAKAQALSTVTIAGTIAGTMAYVAPEQLRGEPLDGRSDLFALGVILQEMLTGERPFQGETEAELLAAILTREPKLIRELRPEVEVKLGRLVRKAMRKFPQDRYASAAEMKAELLSCQNRKTATA